MKHVRRIIVMSLVLLTFSCEKKDAETYVTITVGGPNIYMQGTLNNGVSINSLLFTTTDKDLGTEQMQKSISQFSLMIQPMTCLFSSDKMIDQALEDNISEYYWMKYPGKEITVPESSLPLPPASAYPPVSISYTAHHISAISIISDTELFGIPAGGDLIKCFELATVESGSDQDYCMILSDKSVVDYPVGLTVEEYLAMKPAFAGAVNYKLLSEYSAMIKESTQCRFTVSVTLNDGTVIKQTTAKYELLP